MRMRMLVTLLSAVVMLLLVATLASPAAFADAPVGTPAAAPERCNDCDPPLPTPRPTRTPGPTPTPQPRWDIRMDRLRVVDAQEESWYSNGDEPYFVMMGFRSKFNTPGSTQVFWSQNLNNDWAKGVDDGDERAVPSHMGLVSFYNVRRPTAAQILAGEKPELLGALIIAMEEDLTDDDTIRGLMNDLRDALRAELERLIAGGQLNLANPGPDIQRAVRNVKDSMEPGFWGKVGIFLGSFGDPDDAIGIHFLMFAAVDESLAGSFSLPPIAGATTGVLKAQTFPMGSTPIVFTGDGAKYKLSGSVSLR